MRFRAEQHLRRQSEIRAVREQGRRVDCRVFTVWWRRREAPDALASSPAETPPAAAAYPTAAAPTGASASTRVRPKAPPASLSRVCVIASGAAVGNAVRRNRAKRRLRELFRHNQSAVPAGVDLLLIARAAVTDCPLSDLTRRFHEACRSIDTASAPRA